MKLTQIAAFFAVLLITISCRKGELASPTYYSSLTIDLLNLPNTPSVNVRIGENNITEPVNAGSPFTQQVRLPGGKVKVAVFLPGSSTSFADTLIDMPKNTNTVLRLAYSEELDLKGFIGSTAVDPDSTTIQVFNALPDAIQPNGVVIDAELSITEDAVTYKPTEGVYENFEKGKLHPKKITISAIPDPSPSFVYVLRFKNRTTGQYLTDSNGVEYMIINLNGGKYTIIQAKGGGDPAYPYFEAQYVEL